MYCQRGQALFVHLDEKNLPFIQGNFCLKIRAFTVRASKKDTANRTVSFCLKFKHYKAR